MVKLQEAYKLYVTARHGFSYFYKNNHSEAVCIFIASWKDCFAPSILLKLQSLWLAMTEALETINE